MGALQIRTVLCQILQAIATSVERRCLVLKRMEKIGKTQLTTAYARYYQLCYTSVFWLNAMSELTLRASFQLVAQRILKAEEMETLGYDQVLDRGHGTTVKKKDAEYRLEADAVVFTLCIWSHG